MKKLITILIILISGISAISQPYTYSDLNTFKNTYITTNGTRAITGAIMNSMLARLISSMGVREFDATRQYWEDSSAVLYNGEFYLCSKEHFGSWVAGDFHRLLDTIQTQRISAYGGTRVNFTDSVRFEKGIYATAIYFNGVTTSAPLLSSSASTLILTGNYRVKQAIYGNYDRAGFDSWFRGTADDSLLWLDVSSDRIGIGTGTPECKLEVNGDIKGDSIYADDLAADTLDIVVIQNQVGSTITTKIQGQVEMVVTNTGVQLKDTTTWSKLKNQHTLSYFWDTIITLSSDSILVSNARPQLLIQNNGSDWITQIISVTTALNYNSATYAYDAAGAVLYYSSNAPAGIIDIPETYLERPSTEHRVYALNSVNCSPGDDIYYFSINADPTTGDSDLVFYITAIKRKIVSGITP